MNCLVVQIQILHSKLIVSVLVVSRYMRWHNACDISRYVSRYISRYTGRDMIRVSRYDTRVASPSISMHRYDPNCDRYMTRPDGRELTRDHLLGLSAVISSRILNLCDIFQDTQSLWYLSGYSIFVISSRIPDLCDIFQDTWYLWYLLEYSIFVISSRILDICDIFHDTQS